MEGVLGEVIWGEMKYEGLGMKLPSMKFLFPWSTGLKSWKKLSDGGEKKFGAIGGSEAGPGDKIPGNKYFWSTCPSPWPCWSSISIPCTTPLIIWLTFPWSRGDLAFSIVAYLAAGDIAPLFISFKVFPGVTSVDIDEEIEEEVEDDDKPVKRCTKFMKSLGFVWIIFGETV